jgi:hypothetical protein
MFVATFLVPQQSEDCWPSIDDLVTYHMEAGQHQISMPSELQFIFHLNDNLR